MVLHGINIDGTVYPVETLPDVTSADAGKILQVDASGSWAAASLENAEEATF